IFLMGLARVAKVHVWVNQPRQGNSLHTAMIAHFLGVAGGLGWAVGWAAGFAYLIQSLYFDSQLRISFRLYNRPQQIRQWRIMGRDRIVLLTPRDALYESALS